MIKALLDFKDKPIQRQIYFDRSKIVGAFGGYNSGKSYVMAAKVDGYCEMFPGSRCILGRKTYGALEKSLLITFLEIVKARNGGTLEPGPLIKNWNASKLELTYQNGSVVWFVTFDDVKKVRGPNIAFALISQAEEVAYEIFLELMGRIRQWNPESIAEFKKTHGPKLMEQFGYVPTPFNQLLCEGNPAPNWVRKEFYFNEDKSNSCYIIPSFENKKYHAEGWIEMLKKKYSVEWYNRYVLGSWNVFGGAVYPEFDYDNLHGVQPFKVPDHWPRVIGWDHGFRNPTSIHPGAVDEMGNIVYYKEHYLDNAPVTEHAEAFKEMAKSDKFPVNAAERFMVFMDYSVKGDYDSTGKSVWDHYLDKGIYGLDPDKSVHAGIMMVKEYLKPDLERRFPLWHPKAGQFGSPKLFIMRGSAPNLVNEFQIYQWEEQKEGSERNLEEKPRKWNDHAMDDVRYSVMAVGKNMAPWILPPKTQEEMGLEANKAIARHAFEQAESEYDSAYET